MSGQTVEAKYQQFIDTLKQMVRDHASGQGLIDSYIEHCEELNRLKEENQRLKRENEQLHRFCKDILREG